MGAQRDPVAAVPEDLHVAAVWCAVVNDSRCSHAPLALTVNAQRVGLEPCSPSYLPLVPIATLGSRSLGRTP